MRQIKFRAQDIASNKWLYGDLRHHKDDVCIFEQGGTKGEQVKRDTIGQFVGLKDKNGVEIYEGDILELVVTYKGKPVGEPRIRKVVWKDSGLCIVNKHNDCVCERSTNCQEVEYRVIGNIYDNPDLLTK